MWQICQMAYETKCIVLPITHISIAILLIGKSAMWQNETKLIVLLTAAFAGLSAKWIMKPSTHRSIAILLMWPICQIAIVLISCY